MITNLVAALPAVTQDQKARILSAPRTSEAHRDLLSDVPAMNAVQIGGSAGRRELPANVTAAAWNVERCLFPVETARHLSTVQPDIVLLSEMDHGMARTGQHHTTEIMATSLGMTYAFGVEFFELDLGGPTERPYCKDDFNALGWHGNAILSSAPFEKLAMMRLDTRGHWFVAEGGADNPEQPRLGGRMALMAVVPTEAGPLCVVSVHLESNAGADYRAREFDLLLDAVCVFAPNTPVLIGGDLNTGNRTPNLDWRDETLFARAETRGYSWDFTAEGTTTRPSLITPHPDRVFKLDWFAGRGLSSVDAGILSSVYADGRPLSDHDCVWCRAGL